MNNFSKREHMLLKREEDMYINLTLQHYEEKIYQDLLTLSTSKHIFASQFFIFVFINYSPHWKIQN